MKKNKTFKWSSSQENAFESVKSDLAQGPLLCNYDGQSPLIVEVDASPVGVGCVLLQRIQDKEFPVYFASKKLSSTQQNYAQIDREGLALVF